MPPTTSTIPVLPLLRSFAKRPSRYRPSTAFRPSRPLTTTPTTHHPHPGSRSLPSEADNNNDSSIKWFEQDLHSPQSPRRPLSAPPDTAEAAKLAAEIRALGAETGDTLSSASRLADEALLGPLKGEERERVARALKERRERARELRVGRVRGVGRREGGAVRKFEEAVRDAAFALPEAGTLSGAVGAGEEAEATVPMPVRKQLWRCYARAKRRYPEAFLEALPEKLWSLLWTTQTAAGPENPLALAHAKVLVDDMQSVGRELTTAQWLLALEGEFITGDEGAQEGALRKWEEQYAAQRSRRDGNTDEAAGSDSGTTGESGESSGRAEFLQLGLRMHALLGDVGRAEEIMDELWKMQPDRDPRGRMPVLRAWLRVGGEEGRRKAWELYGLMRTELEERGEMGENEFDTFFVAFGEAGAKEEAMEILEDMEDEWKGKWEIV
ncbi:hypothetical protein W97_05009 [Coniosporium apollinis CBS 100218]|uniref:Uncharacterized protein n=1 Tax=Coniosporium apollinis (strain CBS 100218) TaxID=1168221 RepID=R7YV13_CONA1|nr:uncharacterized protein W97_05009 [Coniosporium apollinis CBS 100218]EON65770.1 hypothetical protein W97_05009 [Coniosporium apollinis CBS 100218]